MLISENGLLTIKEASVMAGTSVTSIYRRINSGKLECKTVLIGDKQIKKVKKSDIESIFGNKGY